MDWFQLIKEFGVSTAIIVAVGVALFRIARWLGPRLDLLLSAFVGFLGKTSDKLEDVHADVRRVDNNVDKVLNGIDDVKSLLRGPKIQ